MKINYKNDTNIHKNILNLPIGTIIEYIDDTSLEESYIGMVIHDTEDRKAICDFKNACIYDDIYNYKVIRIFDSDETELILK